MLKVEDFNFRTDDIEGYYLMMYDESHIHNGEFTHKLYFNTLQEAVDEANKQKFTIVGRSPVLPEKVYVLKGKSHEIRLGAFTIKEISASHFIELQRFLFKKYKTKSLKTLNNVLNMNQFQKDVYMASLKK